VPCHFVITFASAVKQFGLDVIVGLRLRRRISGVGIFSLAFYRSRNTCSALREDALHKATPQSYAGRGLSLIIPFTSASTTHIPALHTCAGFENVTKEVTGNVDGRPEGLKVYY